MEIQISQLKVHPENVKIYGDPENVKELADSIDKTKFIKALVINQDNIIISGHRRKAACELLGIEKVPFERIQTRDEWHLLELLILENKYRVKTTYQMVKESEGLFLIESERAKKRQSEAGGDKISKDRPLVENFPQAVLIKSRDKVAEEIGFGSGRSLATAKKVVDKIEEFVKEGKEKEGKILKAALNRSVSGALNLSKMDLSVLEEDTVDKIVEDKITVAKVKSEIKLKEQKTRYEEKVKADIVKKPAVYNMPVDALLAKYGDSEIDLLFTDPPYMTDVDNIEAFVKSWLPLAIDKTKKTGRLVICTGAYPKEIQAYLNVFLSQSKFELDNPLIWTYRNTIGPSTKKRYKLNYQMVWHLYNEESQDLDTDKLVELFTVQDISAPDGRHGNRYHSWQKPDELANRVIRHTTKRGDIVVDPFCCTGTFVLQASILGRNGIGGDISSDNLEIAIKRGCEYAVQKGLKQGEQDFQFI